MPCLAPMLSWLHKAYASGQLCGGPAAREAALRPPAGLLSGLWGLKPCGKQAPSGCARACTTATTAVSKAGRYELLSFKCGC